MWVVPRYEWVCHISHIWRITLINQLTCEIWLLHIQDETWLIDMWDMTHWHVRYDSCLIDMWDMTMWHDSLTCETWLIDMWDMTHWHVTYDSCLIDMWDMTMCLDMNQSYTHSYLRPDSSTHVTCLIDVWDMTHSYLGTFIYWHTHSYLRPDSFTYVTWLTDMWDITHSYIGTFIYRVSMNECAYIWMCLDMNESCLTCQWVMSHM